MLSAILRSQIESYGTIGFARIVELDALCDRGPGAFRKRPGAPSDFESKWIFFDKLRRHLGKDVFIFLRYREVCIQLSRATAIFTILTII